MLKFTIFLALLHIAAGAKVLFFFGLSTYSHRITVWPLVESLAAKGHDVTFIQPFAPKKANPKVKEFFPKSIAHLGEEKFEEVNLLKVRLEGGQAAVQALASQLTAMGLDLCSKFIQDPETQEWIKKSEFDLVVIDALMNECGFGLAHKFGAKTILWGTTHPFIWWFDVFGFLPETSWISELHLSFQYPMSFMERLMSTLIPVVVYAQKQLFYYPELNRVFRESLQLPDMPSVSDLERNTSLIFTNTHFSEEVARSLPPLVVPVGGAHCEDASQKLTPELEKFINDSNGFIYVSFGSAAKISLAPTEFQDMFYTAMAKSKTKFVWKFEGDRHEKIPKNVFTAKWMPQQAILAHPNIKAFFTHGGLLGMQEAVWHAVPLLSMPVFAEQDYNALRVARTQRGIMLDPNSLTLEILEKSLKEIVENPVYKKNMVSLSRKFKDRPAKPVDTAVWWTEYVLRHDDHSDLKPLGMYQNWFVRRSLDVWAFVFTMILIALLTVSYVAIKILKCLRPKPMSAKKVKTK